MTKELFELLGVIIGNQACIMRTLGKFPYCPPELADELEALGRRCHELTGDLLKDHINVGN